MAKDKRPLPDLLAQLADETRPLPSGLIYRVSEISVADMEVVASVWPEISLDRRQRFAARIASTAAENFELEFKQFGIFLAKDPDENIRAAGMEALEEFEDEAIGQLYLKALQSDDSPLVRKAAAVGLGGHVLLGELGDIDIETARPYEDALIETYQTREEDIEVRRRALESIAFSGRVEVAGLIEEAMQDEDPRMRVSAVFAMGRSGDEQWAPIVLETLEDEDNELRFEAARAAGELELQDAVPRLYELAQERDREIAIAAVDSLGNIGGEDIERFLLRLLKRTQDPEMVASIEDALSNAALAAMDFSRFVAAESDDDTPDVGDDA